MRFSSLLALVFLLLAGCSSLLDRETVESDRQRRTAPQPPSFMTGPAGAVLQPIDGFSAVVKAEITTSSNKVRFVTGRLHGARGLLLFLPSGERNMSFIWSVPDNYGYILNDPLQGYAPVTASTFPSGITTNSDPAYRVTAKLDGHACRREDISVKQIDGSSANLTLWRAQDLGGFPLRIKAPGLQIDFGNIELRVPPAELFTPPASFTKYESPETMMDEILARQAIMKRKPVGPINKDGFDGDTGLDYNHDTPPRR